MAESLLLYVATDDGLFILGKPGTSKEWLPPRHLLEGQAVRASAAMPGPPLRVVVALVNDLPTFQVSMNGGRTWEAAADAPELAATDLPSRDAPLAVPSMKQAQPPVLLMMQDGRLYRSGDDGTAWSDPVPTAPPDLTALTADPLRRERLYAGTQAGTLHTSADRGATWLPLEISPLPRIHHIAVLRMG